MVCILSIMFGRGLGEIDQSDGVGERVGRYRVGS